jgi:hypothetical protein
MQLVERVARELCLKAANVDGQRRDCRFCGDLPDCAMHGTFADEARAAIAVVRASDRGK